MTRPDGPGSYVAIDLETTGLDPATDRVIELGAIRFDRSGRIFASFDRLVNPLRPSHPRALAVHGIDDAILAAEPTTDVVLPEFLAFLGDREGSVLLAHGASFDAAFLGAELARLGGAIPDWPIVDTLALGRRIRPELPSHRLGELARIYGLDPAGSHRALADATRVMGLWLALGGPDLAEQPPPVAYPIHDPALPLPPPSGWEPLSEAVATARRVRLVYEGGTRGDFPREITPRRFLYRGGRAYVSATCHADSREKEFCLERVRSYELLGPDAG